jgi:hypothetical protein
LEPNTRSNTAVSPAVWNLTKLAVAIGEHVCLVRRLATNGDLREHDDTVLVGERVLRRGREALLGELRPQCSDLLLAVHGAADRTVTGRYPLDVVRDSGHRGLGVTR